MNHPLIHIRTLLMCHIALLLSLVLTGCQDEEFGYTWFDVYKSRYNRTFQNTYGDPDPDEDWDGTTRSLTSYESVAESDGWYYEESSTLETLQGSFNNWWSSRNLSSFTLKTTDKTVFELVPLYQSKNSYSWYVSIFIESQGTTFWTKGDGTIQASNDGKNYSTVSSSGNTESSKYVRSKPTKIEAPANSTIYFYFYCKGNWRWTTEAYSYKEYIASVDCDVPSNIKDKHPDYDVKIIACEGSWERNVIYDYSEAVFMLVGYIPQVVYKDQETTTTTTKRYMIEDCGLIDFDFNDVVVDVTRETTQYYTINTETGATTPDDSKPSTTKDIAVIKHLCGTYPIQVVIGNTALPQITNPTDKTQTDKQLAGETTDRTTANKNSSGKSINPATKEFDVTGSGWTPDNNSIKVRVWHDFNLVSNSQDGGVIVSKFPEKGEVPYIIATDATSDWTEEGVAASTKSWWTFGTK